ncbi:hypothetical protein CALCODRAFT_265630 [Calocera cornea HHB12733]|uniref:Uncharacterized protein n=1 Tax=Calocera cornea HHB12733 TaxID=1353952 RepID=A0A165GE66_9BASI|nr:hypothetical protein CALCODRAFT_265630 [Calocera cornea HHB12733]
MDRAVAGRIPGQRAAGHWAELDAQDKKVVGRGTRIARPALASASRSPDPYRPNQHKASRATKFPHGFGFCFPGGGGGGGDVLCGLGRSVLAPFSPGSGLPSRGGGVGGGVGRPVSPLWGWGWEGSSRPNA